MYFFHKCLSLFVLCCLFVLTMVAMKWSSLFSFLLLSSGCRLFSLTHTSSTSFSGLGCRRFLLPHISGRSVSLLTLRLRLPENRIAPYFRQVCQLSLVSFHSLWGVVIYCTRCGILVIYFNFARSWSFISVFFLCEILVITLCEMWLSISPVTQSWSGHEKGNSMCCTLSALTVF